MLAYLWYKFIHLYLFSIHTYIYTHAHPHAGFGHKVYPSLQLHQIRLWHETEMALFSYALSSGCSHETRSFPVSSCLCSLEPSLYSSLAVVILVLVGLLLSCFIVGIRYW